ncbi:MAG: asparagine synthase (glutamine-hydrolyzing), partial [Bacteroidales bacterium]|nr:asparagine synthase (glutamine-hydrolyzing) [Bacteroidales bacterium]
VVLQAFDEWGTGCLDKFNGMWAFVIYDKKKKEIFISRDRYGIKPFYYYSDKNKFIFASEIPSILKILERKPNPNYQVLFDYLVFNRTDQTEMTFFEGIKKLQHGHVIIIRKSRTSPAFCGFEIHKWYDLKQKVKNTVPFKNPEEYKNTFNSAIGLRLRSDVPVGVCLSGGLDSSSIVSTLLKDFNKNDLNTFSAIYEKGSTGDESEYIKEYSSSLTNMFYITPSAESLYADMDDFVTAHGEPVPSTSPYAQFKVMELAKNNVVVTLDGQGADEQLAGYHYFYGFYFKELLKNFRWLRLLSETFHCLNNHKSLYGVKTFLYFLLPKNIKSKVRVAEKGYLNPEFVHNFSSDNQVAGNIYSSDSLNDALFNHFEYKLEHLLKWEDRNSMWFSLESRVPFLDHRLVEKTLAINSDMIINKGITKYILREALKGTLPEKIRA